MTPDEAADVMVRYYDPVEGLVDGRDQPFDFPRQAFWTLVDHARSRDLRTAEDVAEARRAGYDEGYNAALFRDEAQS